MVQPRPPREISTRLFEKMTNQNVLQHLKKDKGVAVAAAAAAIERVCSGMNKGKKTEKHQVTDSTSWYLQCLGLVSRWNRVNIQHGSRACKNKV